MRCPVCKNREEQVGIDLHSEGFNEDIVECKICGSVYSILHGAVEVVKDTQAQSFLEAASECVEGCDYNWAGA